MGKRFLRSIVTDFQTLTASADIVPVDLPVNPLTQLVLTLAFTKNVAAQATSLGNLMVLMLQTITDMSVRHRGENILQGSLMDLAVLNSVLTGVSPGVGEIAQADNEIQFVSIPLNFSRVPFWHEEAFPATQRGNLRFFMTAGALNALWDAASWSIEAIELIEDQPSRFLKYTTLTRALAATGRQKIPLPIGNPLLGALMFDPSDETDSTNSYAFGKVKLLKDNVEQYYAESNWENLRETMERRVLNFHSRWGHIHAQAAADTATGEEQVTTADRPPLQYGYLDFDPLKDGSFALDTEGAASLDLDMNSDVSAGTVRVMPVELVAIPGAGGAA
jgi:hypothetical protein